MELSRREYVDIYAHTLKTAVMPPGPATTPTPTRTPIS